jgi:hypothetical protein
LSSSRRRGWDRRIETALEVLGRFEVETLLLYTADEVTHTFVGPGVFEGRGTGRDALRKMLVAVLRRYIGGFETREEGRYLATDHAVVEWSCRARTPTGEWETFAGVFLVRHEHGQITAIKGYFCPRQSPKDSEHGEGQQVDEDGNHDGDYQQQDY